MNSPIQASSFPAPVKTKISGEDRDRLLVDWQAAKENLDAAKEAELKLRDRIVFETDLFDDTKDKGTQSVDLGNGWKVKAVKKINWTTASELSDGTPIDHALDLIAASAGRMAADELVKFTPEVKLSIFAKLTKEEKAIIEPFLTSKPGTPSLELVPPKA